MRSLLLIPALALTCGLLAAADPTDEKSALENQAASLEKQIGELQQELEAVRAKLRGGRGVTPAEAVEAFRKNSTKPVTVEFGVLPIGETSGLTRVGEDHEPPIVAVWDNYLPGGGTLTAVLPPSVYRKLMLPNKDGTKTTLKPGEERNQVVRHVEKNGIRVTGVLRHHGLDRYTIDIDDPKNVVLYIAGSGM